MLKNRLFTYLINIEKIRSRDIYNKKILYKTRIIEIYILLYFIFNFKLICFKKAN
jgi:hypothetical protein